MCIFCEKHKTIFHSKKDGDYTLSSEISIIENKLITEISTHRYTDTDEYYNSWDIDSDGEFSEQKFVDIIKYCPFCGKELISKYIPRLYIYINFHKEVEEFIQNDKKLKSFLTEIRYYHRDRSPLYYYLELEIRHTIRNELSRIVGHTNLIELDFLTKVDKISNSTYNKVKKTLSKGSDIYIEIESDFPKIQEIINNFKQLTEQCYVFDFKNILFNEEKRELYVTI